jgi:Ca2+-binding RTX toxin-like protein
MKNKHPNLGTQPDDLKLQFEIPFPSSDDYVFPQPGDDILQGSEPLYGTAGDDRLADRRAIYGLGGNDRIYGTQYGDKLVGDGIRSAADGIAGNDEIYGGAGDDRIYGNEGDDLLYGDRSQMTDYSNLREKPGKDKIWGGSGNDRIYGNWGDDELFGEADNDGIGGGIGNDSLNGGSGNDFLTGDGVPIYHNNGTIGLGWDAGHNPDLDVDGNDILNGGTGDDIMHGNGGNDTYYVDSYNDQMFETANGGFDHIISTASYTLDKTQTINGHTLQMRHVENLTLSDRWEAPPGSTLGQWKPTHIDGYGNYLDNTIIGSSGNNDLRGYNGQDTLQGGWGNDTLHGGMQSDRLYGGAGDDLLYGGSHSDLVDGFGGNGSELDTLFGDGPDAITPGADVFAIGNTDGCYYLGSGHALIQDFRRSQGDKIRIHGDFNDYTLVGSSPTTSPNNIRTDIYRNGDLIARVAGIGNLSASDFFSDPILT